MLCCACLLRDGVLLQALPGTHHRAHSSRRPCRSRPQQGTARAMCAESWRTLRVARNVLSLLATLACAPSGLGAGAQGGACLQQL